MVVHQVERGWEDDVVREPDGGEEGGGTSDGVDDEPKGSVMAGRYRSGVHKVQCGPLRLRTEARLSGRQGGQAHQGPVSNISQEMILRVNV